MRLAIIRTLLHGTKNALSDIATGNSGVFQVFEIQRLRGIMQDYAVIAMNNFMMSMVRCLEGLRTMLNDDDRALVESLMDLADRGADDESCVQVCQ